MKRTPVLLTSATLALTLFSCGRGGNGDEGWSGTIEAVEVDVASEAAGQVIKLAVGEGDRVKAEDLVAAVDVEKLELQRQEASATLAELSRNRELNRESLVQAKENLKMVERDLERFEVLWKEKTATKKEYDDTLSRARIARSAVVAAGKAIEAVDARERAVKARIDLLDSRIADGRVVSPIDGYVVEKFVEMGEMVNVGSAVVRVADLNSLFIKMYVAETELGMVQLNSKARLRVDSFPERDFPGRVAWISPEAEFTPKNVQTREARVSLVYAVKVVVPNPDLSLKIGMPADIFLGGSH